MFVAYTLIAALLFAVSTVVKHRSAQAVATSSAARGRLFATVRATLRHPYWLGGIALDAAALGFQVAALHLGPLAVVQPLLTVGLVLALLIDRPRLSRRTLAWSLVLVGALAGLVFVAGTARAPVAVSPGRLPTVAAIAIVIGVVAGCLLLARRRKAGPAQAVTLALGVGVTYAASAALLKVLSDRGVQHGLLAVATSWQLYAVVLCGGAGLLLNQLAFAAGPLRRTLPTIAAADPLLSVLLGVAIYHERVLGGSVLGAVEGALLFVVLIAVLQVSRRRLARPGAPG